jgi:hypothetical protein
MKHSSYVHEIELSLFWGKRSQGEIFELKLTVKCFLDNCFCRKCFLQETLHFVEHCFNLHVMRTIAGRNAHPLLTAIFLSLAAFSIAAVSMSIMPTCSVPQELLYAAIVADELNKNSNTRDSLIFSTYLGLIFDAINREIARAPNFSQVNLYFLHKCF